MRSIRTPPDCSEIESEIEILYCMSRAKEGLLMYKAPPWVFEYVFVIFNEFSIRRVDEYPPEALESPETYINPPSCYAEEL